MPGLFGSELYSIKFGCRPFPGYVANIGASQKTLQIRSDVFGGCMNATVEHMSFFKALGRRKSDVRVSL
jgi:hypothetical protein